MMNRDIDLDYADEDLREELQAITYKFTQRGAIQITPKDEIKKGLSGRSPDRLDAVILSALDVTPWLMREPVGTVKAMDREDIPDYGLMEYIRQPGRPLI